MRSSLAPGEQGQGGFTLIEVLIALAITGFVATIAYTGLSATISGVESTRANAERTYEINRAWMIISRDLRQFIARPVRDEFGDIEPAFLGGEAARHLLGFTRSGWHNSNNQPRSNLQRVQYDFEEETLWRESYVVLDRAGDSTPSRVNLLDDIEFIELRFLDTLEAVETDNRDNSLDTRDWQENWVMDPSSPGAGLAPPVAVEIRMQLNDLGEVRRLYALPPL